MKVIIKKYDEQYIKSLNILLKEVYGLEKIGSFNNVELIAVHNDEVIGYLTINPLYDSVRGIKYAFLNYVCVKKEYRNLGIASYMLEKVFNICRDIGISYIELTSNENRKEAQYLYKNMGFVIRETNVYRKEIL